MFLLIAACLKDYLVFCQQLISGLPFGLNQAEVTINSALPLRELLFLEEEFVVARRR